MKNNCGGFVLVMTLLLVSVISLFLLASLQHLLVYYNGFIQLNKAHQAFYQLDTLARQVAKEVNFGKGCVVQEIGANTVVKRLLSHKGCAISLNAHSYVYLIEELGDFPCLVSLRNNKNMSTRHRRISLLSLDENKAHSLIQLRQITAIDALFCEGKKQKVSIGVSSWRYKSYF